MLGVSGILVVTTAGAAVCPVLPTRLRVHRAPGIPCALSSKGRRFGQTSREKPAARSRSYAQLSITLRCHRPRRRATQYSRDASDGAEKPRRTGSPAFAGDDNRCWWSAVLTLSTLPSKAGIRSTRLTNFWHCGCRRFSFRTAPERGAGNQPSMVLAEDGASKGSGNADSQPNVRSSGEGGRCRLCLRDSGCVLAHPAYRRPASYRPLRAVWALCAWALRGCARSPDPFSAPG
jgi:hypothetical protein